MKLVWHIIQKDIRRDRWALLLWVALFLGQAALGLVVFHHDGGDRGWLDTVRACNVILVAVQFASGFILVVRLLQADAITGTRTFWRTRPISPARLLLAKSLGALLLVGLLPVLLRLPWWLYCGFAARDMAWAGIELLGWQSVVIAPALLIASLTEEFTRAVMWGLLLVTALLAGVLFLQHSSAGAKLLFGLLGDIPGRVDGLFFTRLWLAAVLLVAGSALIARHQVLTRHWVRSVVLIVPLVGLMVAAARFWPWDCAILFTQLNAPRPSEPVAPAAERAFAGVQLTAGPVQIGGRGEADNIWNQTHTWVFQTMQVEGIPEGYAFQDFRLVQSWLWAGDPAALTYTSHFWRWSDTAVRQALGLPAWQGDPETFRWLQERDRDRVSQGLPSWLGYKFWLPQLERDRLPVIARFALDDAVIARLRAQPPLGRARAELELARPQLVFELPMKSSGRWAGRSHAFRVGLQDKFGRHNTSVQLTEASPGVVENGIWYADAIDEGPHREFSDQFMAVNRHSHNVDGVSRSGDASNSGRVIIGGVVLEWGVLHVQTLRVIRDGEWTPYDPDWPEHTSLVWLDHGPVIRLTRELKAEKYELLPGALKKPDADEEGENLPRKI